ncbi:MAG TPA: 4-(cytidine 5'-diphospho)-2-C-methyl-D-erythritol kinase [Candidatus Polarisedimenticolaceae bacterium]|nr:4-(cytidine 5'-diphospho)-2-C-methyl-D-erythritol kinase [Candidatus Polarisedimenticolaceae bacterium]
MTGRLVRCPAKVNVGLRVLGRRPDGFHEIVTLFQAIDLWDELRAEPDVALTLSVEGEAAPSDASNLVLRAARSLLARAGADAARGARLHLVKRIPAGAGLGGGSSDAAGALLLLSRLWGLRTDEGVLAGIAAELGSDVPFFLSGGTALGTGRGERIRPLTPISERALVLGHPPLPLPTPRVYEALQAPLTPADDGVTVSRLFVKLAEGNDFALARNDLEAAAFAMIPALAGFRDALVRSGAEVALLSGSGSTVFGMFRAGTDLTSIAAGLQSAFPGWRVRTSRTIASGVVAG